MKQHPLSIDLVRPIFMRTDTFDHIVCRERSTILNFINASVRDRHVAEDLTQECFWRAAQGWSEFRGESSAHTWLRHIAMNVIRNFVRNKKSQLFRWAVSMDDVVEASLVDDAQLSPEAVAIYRDSVTRIWAAADRISPKQQIAMRLRFEADLELTEIATTMGITEGSVKVHLSRAVQSIRSSLRRDLALRCKSNSEIKSKSVKGPFEILIIDHVERPSDN